ncbi:hypothetical protein EUTSA_v10009364mg, partial [Eutrema salsugineum]
YRPVMIKSRAGFYTVVSLVRPPQLTEKKPKSKNFQRSISTGYLTNRSTLQMIMSYMYSNLLVSHIEIRCRGQQLSPLLTMQQVRDTIWSPTKSSLPSSSPSFILLRDSSTSDHVMILHYGRTA